MASILDCDFDLRNVTVIYLDTEFTNLQQPELLSLGMVNGRGEEVYCELDPDDPDSSAPRRSRAGDVAADHRHFD